MQCFNYVKTDTQEFRIDSSVYKRKKMNSTTLYMAVREWVVDPEKAEAKYGKMGDWDTRNVTTMNNLFEDMPYFNEDIGRWNTGRVTNMSNMFRNAYTFNQPIGAWDTSSVEMMAGMFYCAYMFNQPISEWDTKNVKNMSGMFYRATSFNQPIDSWNVSNVNIMDCMFECAFDFNQSLEGWKPQNVKVMKRMFYGAIQYNQPFPSSWTLDRGINKSFMFEHAKSFHQPVQKIIQKSIAPSVTYILEQMQRNHQKKEIFTLMDYDKYVQDSMIYPQMDIDNCFYKTMSYFIL